MMDAVFFIYLSASCVGVAIVALLVLIFRVQSERSQSKHLLMAFIIITFLIGLLYFGERFYTDNFETRGGWPEAVRALDLLLCDAQLFFWCRFLHAETESGERWIRRSSDWFVAGAFIVQLFISLFLMNDHYYIDSPAGRAFATGVYIAFMLLSTVLLVGHIRLVKWRHPDPRARKYLTGISLLLLLDVLGESFYVIMLFRGSPLLAAGLYAAFDLVSVAFLLINVLAVVYIFRCEIGRVFPAIPRTAEEQQAEKRQQQEEQFLQEGLSQRETEVALLLLEGASYDEIAEGLFISKYTVKRHAHNIYGKLGVANKVELISRFG